MLIKIKKGEKRFSMKKGEKRFSVVIDCYVKLIVRNIAEVQEFQLVPYNLYIFIFEGVCQRQRSSNIAM